MPMFKLVPSADAVNAWWDDHVRGPVSLSPQGFARKISIGLPNPAAVELSVSGLVDAKAALGLTGPDNGYLVGNSIRLGSARCLYNDATMFAPALQGRGYGTSVTRNMLEVAIALRLPKLRLVACMGGPYAWVAMGFLPLPKDWGHVCERVRAFVALMKGELEDVELVILNHVSTHRDPKAVRQLTLLERELDGCPIEAFEGHTVGRAVLAHMDMRFEAVLDLSDIDNAKYFYDYIGRAKRA